MKETKENLLSMEEYLRKTGELSNNEFTPHILIIQRHLENIENTYGLELLEATLRVMGIQSAPEVKRKKVS